MPGAVFDSGDLGAVGGAVSLGAQLVQQSADGVHDFDVGLFVPAADVVDLAELASFQHAADGAAVVLHIQPVAHLHAVAVNRQRFAGQCVDDHQRNELFRKMIRAVVVGAIGGEHRQAVGVVVGAYQVVAGGLAGAVGAVGLVAVGFGEGGVSSAQRAIDLVGRNVQEAKAGFGFAFQPTPVGAHGFQQAKGADNVGLDEVFGAVDGAVHVAFGGEVDDGAGLVLGQ